MSPGISLLVGRVGIMNVMLVSVTERTREIGVRMAVGARGIDILFQFLVESVLLSCFGGAIGLGLGVGASILASHVINTINSDMNWPVMVSIPAAVVAMVFSAMVSSIFRTVVLYPAWRASRLDPIDALRYE